MLLLKTSHDVDVLLKCTILISPGWHMFPWNGQLRWGNQLKATSGFSWCASASYFACLTGCRNLKTSIRKLSLPSYDASFQTTRFISSMERCKTCHFDCCFTSIENMETNQSPLTQTISCCGVAFWEIPRRSLAWYDTISFFYHVSYLGCLCWSWNEINVK